MNSSTTVTGVWGLQELLCKRRKINIFNYSRSDSHFIIPNEPSFVLELLIGSKANVLPWNDCNLTDTIDIT